MGSFAAREHPEWQMKWLIDSSGGAKSCQTSAVYGLAAEFEDQVLFVVMLGTNFYSLGLHADRAESEGFI